MVVLIVLVTFVVFVLVDLFLRLTLKRLEEKKVRLAREEALKVGLRLDFTDEAKSLKRAEVSHARARRVSASVAEYSRDARPVTLR